MVLFLIGILEMIIATAWTKVVSATKVWSSGAITLVNILIWYYVLQAIIEDISNWRIVVIYAIGCAVGTMLTTLYFSYTEKAKRRAKRREVNPRVVAYADHSPDGGAR